MKQVYVVTCPQLGWDCVIGVYSFYSVKLAELEKQYPYSDGYVIQIYSIEALCV